MASILKLWYARSITVNGVTYATGSRSTAIEINIETGKVYNKNFSIPDSTEVEIFSAGSEEGSDPEDISDADFIEIISDQDGFIQVLINEDDGNEIGGAFKLRADVPFILGYDEAMHGTVANIDTWEADWSADVVDRIEFWSDSGNTANVSVFAVT